MPVPRRDGADVSDDWRRRPADDNDSDDAEYSQQLH